MSWKIEGRYFENCNCDAVCPCTWSNLSRQATYDDCRATLGFRIERGHIDDVDVSGRTMVLSLVSPKLMVEGNWRAGLVFDADTSDDHMALLTSVFTGALGGPMAGLAPLMCVKETPDSTATSRNSTGPASRIEVAPNRAGMNAAVRTIAMPAAARRGLNGPGPATARDRSRRRRAPAPPVA